VRFLENAGQEIYMMDANGDNQANLTNKSGRDISPAWSPDAPVLRWGVLALQ